MPDEEKPTQHEPEQSASEEGTPPGSETSSAHEPPEAKPGAEKKPAPRERAMPDARSKLERARAAAAVQPEGEKPSKTQAAGPAKTDDTSKSKLEKARSADAAKEPGQAPPKPSKVEAARAAKAPSEPSRKPAGPPKPGPKAPPPPRTQRPPAAAPKSTRRSFITWFVVAWISFAAACFAMLVGMLRFMFPNWRREPPSTFKVGAPDEYPPESVSTKWKAKFGVWVVHAEYEGQSQIYALRTVCTHLGCTPNWLEAEQKFKCPCHGSGFYITGINFEGPAPRPLERYAIRVAPDGQLEVDKSRIFQEEMEQWNDPNSFVTA